MKSDIDHLRNKIKIRSQKLNIRPEHTEEAHFYRYGNYLYKSVTGHLQILKDPGLANWKMNRALKYIKDNIYDITPALVDEFIVRAKEEPQAQFTGAGDLGTRVHNWREQWFTDIIRNGELPSQPSHSDEDSRFVSAARAIKKFKDEHDYQPVACELYVADHDLQTGGQVDDIGFVDGVLSMVDLKTSNIGDKESYFAQVALYYYMFCKLYKVRPEKLYILHVSKVDGTYNLINIPLTIQLPESSQVFDLVKWAKSVVRVNQGLELIKESKRKTPIII